MNSESQPKVNIFTKDKMGKKVLRLLIGYPWPSQNARDSETACFGEMVKPRLNQKLVWKPIVSK